ncbi:MAG: hypothetical protein ACYC0P_03035 [Thiobacillus sp.]
MAQLDILQQRLERAKAALRDAKKREREREQQRIFDLVRRSGLSLADLETLLANRAVSAPVSAPAVATGGNDFESGEQQ